MKYCPVCDSQLTADTEVYTKRRKNRYQSVEIVGCDNCIRSTWADEFFDEEDLLELEGEYIDNAQWEMAKDKRYRL